MRVDKLSGKSSRLTWQRFVDYCATKAAALAFHDGLAAELRSVHKCPEIRTTSVHPGWADTPLIAENVEKIRKRAHVMPPQEVSDAVVKQ